MEIQFVKDCGHRKEGDVLEVSFAQGEQYIGAGFAEVYVEKESPPKDESLPESILNILEDAGVDTYSNQLNLASDAEIMSIKGIGKVALEEIRTFYPEKKVEAPPEDE